VLSLLVALLVPLGLSDPAARPMGAQAGFGGLGGAPARQVRIEERVIIRVQPGIRRSAPPPLPRPEQSRWRERSVGKCLPLYGLGGVRVEDDERLLLFLRDKRVIRARLDRACSAREFYSGFYVERSADGRLCAGRDLLLARSGASCSLTRLRLLVPPKR